MHSSLKAKGIGFEFLVDCFYSLCQIVQGKRKLFHSFSFPPIQVWIVSGSNHPARGDDERFLWTRRHGSIGHIEKRVNLYEE